MLALVVLVVDPASPELLTTVIEFRPLPSAAWSDPPVPTSEAVW
jgi:hypothetical protein